MRRKTTFGPPPCLFTAGGGGETGNVRDTFCDGRRKRRKGPFSRTIVTIVLPLVGGPLSPSQNPTSIERRNVKAFFPPSPFSSSSTIDISQSVLWPLSPLARPLTSSRYPFPGEDKGHRTTPLPFPPFPLLPCDPLFATQRLRRGGYIFKIIRALASPHVLDRGRDRGRNKSRPISRS